MPFFFFVFWVATRLSTMPPASSENTTPSERPMPISTPKYSRIILEPIKPSTNATAGRRYGMSLTALATKVYKLQRIKSGEPSREADEARARSLI